MKAIITNVNEYDYELFEVRCYERGTWAFDSYQDEEEDAIARMNKLMQEYDFKPDEVRLAKITYYENIIDELPF